jgi:chromosome segregation ATPase
MEDYICQKGEEATSKQTLLVENQARLKDIAVLLNKDNNTLVQEADQIRDLLQLIDQDIPSILKASLESTTHLDDYFAMVRKVSKNISSRTTLQNDRTLKKQEAKELHSQIQNAKHSLSTLDPELKSMEEKSRLEAQLAQLNAKIQSHKDKMADLPNSIAIATAKIAYVIKEDQQFKSSLANIQGSKDEDQKVLDNVSRIRDEAIDAINQPLSE